MSHRWFVVDTAGVQHGSPHDTETDALLALISLVWELPPAVENPYRVEAHTLVSAQTAR